MDRVGLRVPRQARRALKQSVPDISLDLRHLQCAILASEFGSFRRAAEALELPQSSVSRRIQLLERRLGFPLFERSSKGVQLTPAGAAFIENAVVAAEQIATAARAAVAIHRRQEGILRIGVARKSETFRNVLAQFRTRLPHVRVTLTECSNAEAKRGVASGELDLAFVQQVDGPLNLATTLLWRDPVFAVFGGQHRLLNCVELTWADISGETFLVCADGPSSDILGCLMTRLGNGTQLPKIEVHEVSEAGLFDLVAMDFGITLTSDPVPRAIDHRISVRPIRGAADAVQIMAIWRAESIKPAARKMITISQQSSKNSIKR